MKLPRIHAVPRRVVVTGMGAVAPNGIGIHAYGAALRNGTSGIGAISLFDADGMECRVAAEVKGFAAEDFLSLQEMRRVGRAVPLLIAATAEALERARICWQRLTVEEKQSWGVIVGSGGGTTDFMEDQYRLYFADRLRKVRA